MVVEYIKEKDILRIVEATKAEYHQTKLHLTRFVKNHKFNPRVKMGVWDGKISHFKEDGSFNMGLWKEVYGLCKLNGWEFKMINKNEFPINRDVTYEDVEKFCKEFFKDHKTKDGKTFFPYDHQILSAFKILKNQYCIAEVATGGGKSLIFSIVAFYTLTKIDPTAKFLLIVPSISLVNQFYDDLLDYNLGFNEENKNPLNLTLEEIMSDKPRRSEDVANIIIGTYQSLEKKEKKWFSKFYGVVCDEAHKASNSNTKSSGIKLLTKVISRTFGTSKLRFGLSGTFPDESSVEYLTITSLMGPKIVEIEAKELIEKGVISPVKIKSLILNHNDVKFNDTINLIKKAGNAKACYELERKYIHASEKRLNFIIDKLLKNITKNTLVLFQIIEFGELVYNRCREELQNIDVFYIDGSVKSEKRNYIKQQMELTDGNPKLLIASYGVFSTGVSIKALTNIVLLESYKSEQIVIQTIGRGLRIHSDKDRANIFDIIDVFDSNHQKNILFNHYKERKKYYTKRNYPFEELKINL
jgi:superfamily II DNA or RNA helicase